MTATSCKVHNAHKVCSSCQATFCSGCSPGETCKDCAYKALTSGAAARAEQGAAPAAPQKKRNLVPILVVSLLALALSTAYAARRLLASGAEPTYEELVPGSVLSLWQICDFVDGVQASGGLPDSIDLLASTGVKYEKLGVSAYALAVVVNDQTIRVESRDGKRVYSGKGTEALVGAGAGK